MLCSETHDSVKWQHFRKGYTLLSFRKFPNLDFLKWKSTFIKLYHPIGILNENVKEINIG